MSDTAQKARTTIELLDANDVLYGIEVIDGSLWRFEGCRLTNQNEIFVEVCHTGTPALPINLQFTKGRDLKVPVCGVIRVTSEKLNAGDQIKFGRGELTIDWE